jgi:D-alanyl-D-alanine carboxypeptidase
MKLIYELPAPFVTATQWCIVDRKTNDLLFGRRENESRQVASLTKVMTSTVVLDTIDEYGGQQFMSL